MILENIQIAATAASLDEKTFVEDMVVACGEYVAAVTREEIVSLNIAGRIGQDLRDEREDADKVRTHLHDAAISDIKIVNRLCVKNNVPPVYDGPDDRHAYGDFIFKVVQELGDARK